MGGTRTTNRNRRDRGFTIVDVIVACSVIALLVMVLMPAMNSARESARRVQCASNLRQMGISVMTYSHEHNDRIPSSVFDADLDTNPPVAGSLDQAVYLRVANERSDHQLVWDSHGKLVEGEYIQFQETFYCPSHEGEFTFEAYADERESGEGDIVSNYHYRVDDGYRPDRLLQLPPTFDILADSMRSIEEYSHATGSNILSVDGSSRWFNDSEGAVADHLASTVNWFDTRRLQPVDLWPQIGRASAGVSGP